MSTKSLALASLVIIIVVAAAVLFMIPKQAATQKRILKVAMGTDIVTLDPTMFPITQAYT